VSILQVTITLSSNLLSQIKGYQITARPQKPRVK